MKLLQITLAVVMTGFSIAAATALTAQEQITEPGAAPSAKESARAEAYYNFTIGHIYEQQYEATSSTEYATQAIEAYKKASAPDPKPQAIGYRLPALD